MAHSHRRPRGTLSSPSTCRRSSMSCMRSTRPTKRAKSTKRDRRDEITRGERASVVVAGLRRISCDRVLTSVLCAQARAMADPEIQQILGDPQMRSILQEMQSDPKKASTPALPITSTTTATAPPPPPRLPADPRVHLCTGERGDEGPGDVGEAAEAHCRRRAPSAIGGLRPTTGARTGSRTSEGHAPRRAPRRRASPYSADDDALIITGL